MSICLSDTALPQIVCSVAFLKSEWPTLQVVDFQWNPHDPWTFMSVSDDVSDELGGGTLQLWRVNDLIYRPEAEVLAELDKHRYRSMCCCADKCMLADTAAVFLSCCNTQCLVSV